MKLIRKNISWLLVVLAVAILIVHTYVLYLYASIGWDTAITDGAISTTILSGIMWLIYLLVNRYPTRVGIVTYAFLTGLVFAFISGYAQFLVLKWYVGGKDFVYLKWLSDTMFMRYLLNGIVCCWMATSTAISKGATELKLKFKQHADASALLKEAELYKLRQQLQPHFLYNSLNSISALTMISPVKAQEMIGKLSEFLRASVKREAQDRILIQDELAYIEAYLGIEAIRFGDRLKVVIEKNDLDHAYMPPFLLQPLLENAIKFGLYGVTGAVTIAIDISLQENMLTASITNPYDPQTHLPKGTGFGLEGVRRRLHLLYARTDLLETLQDENLFTVKLNIPQTNA